MGTAIWLLTNSATDGNLAPRRETENMDSSSSCQPGLIGTGARRRPPPPPPQQQQQQDLGLKRELEEFFASASRCRAEAQPVALVRQHKRQGRKQRREAKSAFKKKDQSGIYSAAPLVTGGHRLVTDVGDPRPVVRSRRPDNGMNMGPAEPESLPKARASAKFSHPAPAVPVSGFARAGSDGETNPAAMFMAPSAALAGVTSLHETVGSEPTTDELTTPIEFLCAVTETQQQAEKSTMLVVPAFKRRDSVRKTAPFSAALLPQRSAAEHGWVQCTQCQKWNPDLLCACVERDWVGYKVITEEEDDDDVSMQGEQEEYIDDLIDRRYVNGETEYLVKWIGIDDQTWENERNLCSCQNKIEEFDRQKQSALPRRRHAERADSHEAVTIESAIFASEALPSTIAEVAASETSHRIDSLDTLKILESVNQPSKSVDSGSSTNQTQPTDAMCSDFVESKVASADSHDPGHSSSSQNVVERTTAMPVTNAADTKDCIWVQCEGCEKWRRAPESEQESLSLLAFRCEHNTWDGRNSCTVPEEGYNNLGEQDFVEAVLGKRTTRSGKLEYRLKWYGTKEKTWELVENCDSCRALISEYEIRAAQKDLAKLEKQKVAKRQRVAVKVEPVQQFVRCRRPAKPVQRFDGQSFIGSYARKANAADAKDFIWVQCEGCEKWRRAPESEQESLSLLAFRCEHNTWDGRNSCTVPEEGYNNLGEQDFVEAVLGKRTTRSGKLEYRLKWYGTKEKTWELVENCDSCRALISEYER